MTGTLRTFGGIPRRFIWRSSENIKTSFIFAFQGSVSKQVKPQGMRWLAHPSTVSSLFDYRRPVGNWHMLPSLFPSNLNCSRDKRPNCTAVLRTVDSAKRLAVETREDTFSLPLADGETEAGAVEGRRTSNSDSGIEASSSSCSGDGLTVAKRQHADDSATTQNKWSCSRSRNSCSSTSSSGPPTTRNSSLVLKALQISHARRVAKMEGSKQPQRSAEEVELALEVLNDELAGASPLDRPSLELATQALTDRLVELKKQQRQAENSAEAAEGTKQSTHEYSSSLEAVIVGDGRQKYTLIRIPKQDDMHADIYLVRGDPKAEYHYQTAIETLNALQSRNILSDVLGGGRMDVLRAEKKVEIYGYSYQYGAADHSITAKMMKEHLGDEFIVSFGNYGY
ncbi:14 kDa phosphohistidine phosphatase, putative [Eimeria brunetti]|uniref:14 kDa phosphohistidine phosphatase, putative n=1 Tax=Eimeria brunetti TaxID=51314 RepID=U6LGD4_9EIME|nr:14 kDa phosphohistidine phosphatase, putative [Eimeria brunetti]